MKYSFTLLFTLFISLAYAQGNRERLCGFKNGLKNGTCKVFYPDGKIKEIANWKRGKLDGEYFLYYENGKLYSTGNLKKGKRDGTWKYYFDSGIQQTEEIYKYEDFMEKKTGLFKYFFPSGKLKSTVTYIDDKKKGPQTIYNESGEVIDLQQF